MEIHCGRLEWLPARPSISLDKTPVCNGEGTIKALHLPGQDTQPAMERVPARPSISLDKTPVWNGEVTSKALHLPRQDTQPAMERVPAGPSISQDRTPSLQWRGYQLGPPSPCTRHPACNGEGTSCALHLLAQDTQLGMERVPAGPSISLDKTPSLQWRGYQLGPPSLCTRLHLPAQDTQPITERVPAGPSISLHKTPSLRWKGYQLGPQSPWTRHPAYNGEGTSWALHLPGQDTQSAMERVPAGPSVSLDKTPSLEWRGYQLGLQSPWTRHPACNGEGTSWALHLRGQDTQPAMERVPTGCPQGYQAHLVSGGWPFWSQRDCSYWLFGFHAQLCKSLLNQSNEGRMC